VTGAPRERILVTVGRAACAADSRQPACGELLPLRRSCDFARVAIGQAAATSQAEGAALAAALAL